MLGAVVVMLLIASPAAGDSVSVITRDAGGGSIEATVQSSVSCENSWCAWFTHAVERHSSLPCSGDTTFIRWVGNYHEGGATSATESFKFQPFFPRATKLCVFLTGPGGMTTTEATITLPVGYGMQRSSGYNCSDFGRRASAQYYLNLYPDDPSGLDADSDGAACEHLPCPCGAEPIPAEPIPAEPVPPPTARPAPIALPSGKGRAHLPYISTNTFGCGRIKVAAGDGWMLSDFSPNESHPFTAKIELKLRGPIEKPKKFVTPGAKHKVGFGRLPAGRYRLTIRYPGDAWHLPSGTKKLRPKVHRCRR